MVLLNTTFHVHRSIDSLFVEWVKQVYIPTAKTAELTNPLFTRIIADSDPEGTSYAVQLHAQSLDRATSWHETDAARLKDELAARWGERVLHFSTYMDIID